MQTLLPQKQPSPLPGVNDRHVRQTINVFNRLCSHGLQLGFLIPGVDL
jgi:hypothetical protein